MPTSSPERSNGAGARSLDPATRRSARIAGVWWLITFATSIPALLLYDPLLNDSNYILTKGAETRIQIGAFLGGRSCHLGNRDGGRDVPHPQAPEPEHGPGLRRVPHCRVGHDRRRDR